MDASNSTATRMVRRGITKLYRDCSKREFDVPPRNYSTMSASLTIISVLLLFGLWFFWRARGKSKDEEVFTSAARSDHSDLHFTRHYDDGAQTISGQGVITKQKPEDENYPGEVRRRLRTSEDRESQDTNSVSETSWASHNTSADTLVAPWQGSRRASTVSLRDRSKNEKHEGLIELDVAGKRKAFFKPSTGEFFHISPWKSTHSDSEDSDDDDRFGRKAEEKHSTHRALGQMVAGGVSWAVGKRVDQELAERLQRKVDNRKHRQPPQRAGDCLAGEVTNEWPTGKPTIV